MPRLLRAAFALFLAVAAVLLLRARDSSREDAPLAGKAGAVVRVELSKGAKSKTLERKGGRWQGGPDGECDALVLALSEVRLGAVASRKGSEGPYGLSEREAVRARVTLEGAASPALDGYFGAPALGPGTAYYRHFRDETARVSSGLGRAALERALE